LDERSNAFRVAALPDGRRVSGSQPDPIGDWTVHLVGVEDHASSGRWLVDAISELLGLPSRGRPDWVFDVARELAAHDTPFGRRYPCPCCDYLTLDGAPPGTYAICPICWWEDDLSPYLDLDYEGGPNRISLRRARENYRREGVAKSKHRDDAREPLPGEVPPRSR
jgi:Cysteine-rich CPCC